jgi:hypothetical protein
MKAPITSAQAMSHPTVVETINTLCEIAIELRAELETVRAGEREACATIALDIGNATEPDDFALDKCNEIENAIRARGTI